VLCAPHLQHPGRQGHLRQVPHIAAAGMEAEHHLHFEAAAAQHLKQLLVAGPVVGARGFLDRRPLQAAEVGDPHDMRGGGNATLWVGGW
jgi:hypothetical protein